MKYKTVPGVNVDFTDSSQKITSSLHETYRPEQALFSGVVDTKLWSSCSRFGGVGGFA